MYAAQLQIYKNVQQSVMSGREIEAQVLTNAALRLKDCQNKWDKEGHSQRLEEALRLNQRIWTIFQSELTGKDNPLPQNIKKNLLTLSMFVDKQTFEIMAAPASEKLDIIININLNIAAGLRGN